MEKQKICIIGGGLAGLTTAITLSKLNCNIDLITGVSGQNLKSSRTIAVSENNFDFLNKLNISESLKREVWTCSIMKLYTEIKNEKFFEIFELNNENKQEKILYMLENSKIMKLMINKIKKIKSVSLKKNKRVNSIYTSGALKHVKFNNNVLKYNLVIICTGHNSDLIKNLFKDKIIENSYKELAITTILEHGPLKNNIARQIFLDYAIFALLPVSETKTSVVWTIKKSMRKKNNFSLKNKIKLYASNYLKNIKFNSNIESKDLSLLIRSKYYLERTLLFGDALHLMHPFVGQSFNMTIRDLICLEKILSEKINLGLDIGSLDVLSEFSNEAKPRNFTFSIGSDLLKNALLFKKTRNDIFQILNKSNFAKDIVFDVANKGFRF